MALTLVCGVALPETPTLSSRLNQRGLAYYFRY